MRRVKRQVLKASRKLTDAQPVFVAMVKHGANQTPFHVVKTDDEDEATPAQAGQPKEPIMPKAAKKEKTATVTRTRVRTRTKAEAAASPTPEVASMFFPVEKFVTEGDVTKYLTEHGYTDIPAIEKDALGWTVKAHADDEFEGDIRDIEGPEGVDIRVGFLKAVEKEDEAEPVTEAEGAVNGAGEPDGDEDEEEEVEDDAPADKTDEPAAGKSLVFDDAHAMPMPEGMTMKSAVIAFDKALSTGKAELDTMKVGHPINEPSQKFDSIQEVLGYMSDAPPGFYDIVTAFSYVVRSAVQSKDYNVIRKASRELGEYTIQLASLFETPDDTATESADAPAPKADATKTAKLAAVIAEVKPGKKKPDAEAAQAAEQKADEPVSDDPIANAITKALGPVMEVVKGLKDQVEQIAVANATVDKGSKKPAGTEPGRKGITEGAEAEEAAPPVEKSFRYSDQAPQDKLTRSLMGLAPLKKRA